KMAAAVAYNNRRGNCLRVSSVRSGTIDDEKSGRTITIKPTENGHDQRFGELAGKVADLAAMADMRAGSAGSIRYRIHGSSAHRSATGRPERGCVNAQSRITYPRRGVALSGQQSDSRLCLHGCWTFFCARCGAPGN